MTSNSASRSSESGTAPSAVASQIASVLVLLLPLLLPQLLPQASASVTNVTANRVFRCANAYSDQPCPEGKAIDVDDARSETQRAAAESVAIREAALASQMTRDRVRAETIASATGAQTRFRKKGRADTSVAPSGKPTQPSSSRSLASRGPDFVAFTPRKPKVAAKSTSKS